MATPTVGVVPVIQQVGDPTNNIFVIRGSLAGGQDVILRSGGVIADLTLPPSGNVVVDGQNQLTVVNTLYIGPKARFTAISNGLRLEIQNALGSWIKQAEWTA